MSREAAKDAPTRCCQPGSHNESLVSFMGTLGVVVVVVQGPRPGPGHSVDREEPPKTEWGVEIKGSE